jgi:hypothetical protein
VPVERAAYLHDRPVAYLVYGDSKRVTH